MAAVLIKILTALFVLLAVLQIILCVSCMIVVRMWTQCHWPKGGFKDD